MTCASVYGSDYKKILALMKEDASLKNKIIDDFPYTWAEVIWAVRHEMARTVEDVLARRLRLLFLDAKAALRAAPSVADLMAGELWKKMKNGSIINWKVLNHLQKIIY